MTSHKEEKKFPIEYMIELFMVDQTELFLNRYEKLKLLVDWLGPTFQMPDIPVLPIDIDDPLLSGTELYKFLNCDKRVLYSLLVYRNRKFFD